MPLKKNPHNKVVKDKIEVKVEAKVEDKELKVVNNNNKPINLGNLIRDLSTQEKDPNKRVFLLNPILKIENLELVSLLMSN